MQETLQPPRTIIFEDEAHVACPMGMAVIAGILFTDMFVRTSLEHLSVNRMATFPSRVFVSTMERRQLLLPDPFGISKKFHHGCMECTVMVPANVSVYF